MDPKAERIGDEEECTIHIPTSKVGLVIGVSGAVRTRIKVESGVQQYKVERDGSDARVRVYGNRTCVDKATDMTNQALRTEAADDTLEMHVPNKEVPSLIGKSGMNIKRIIQEPGAHVKVDQDGLEHDAIVWIQSTFGSVKTACLRIKPFTNLDGMKTTLPEDRAAGQVATRMETENGKDEKTLELQAGTYQIAQAEVCKWMPKELRKKGGGEVQITGPTIVTRVGNCSFV